MSASDVGAGSIFGITLLGLVSQIDRSAFFTILVAIVLAVGSAYVTYRVANQLKREIKKEIKERFDEHIEKMHADHKEMIQAVSETAAEKD